MGSRYPSYLLTDGDAGKRKEAKIARTEPSSTITHGRIRQGFAYDRVPHIMLSSIANNTEIDVIFDEFQAKLEPLREKLNAALEQSREERKIPREPGERWEPATVTAHEEEMTLRLVLASTMDILVSLDLESQEDRMYDMIESKAKKPLMTINKLTGGKFDFKSLPGEPHDPCPTEAKKLHSQWWKLRIERQKEIDASITAKADFKYLYDKRYEAKTKVRVAGSFTVESLSPHRILGADENDDLIASRPFDKPKAVRIALKVNDYLGDEVMKESWLTT